MAISNDDSKDKLKSRLARAIGHLNAVYRMVEEEKYCIDVLHQLKAVQAALDKTSELILKQHLQTCVVEAIQKQDSTRVIEELVQVFKQAPTLYSSGEDAVSELVSITNSVQNGKNGKNTDEAKASSVAAGASDSNTDSKPGCCH